MWPFSQYPTDMSELVELLDQAGYKYRCIPHEVMQLPEMHIYVYANPDDSEPSYSVIKGNASFGDYELYSINDDTAFPDPERYDTAAQTMTAIKQAAFQAKRSEATS